MKRLDDFQATVLGNRLFDDRISLLEFYLPGFDGKAEPGQFVMIKSCETYDPFLRRPYSIFECKKERIKILLKIVGSGSRMISEKRKNEKISILGPLGNGFSINKNLYPILVAGGIGIAPLWFLAKRLKSKKADFSLIYGERTASFLGSMLEKDFGKKIVFVTDDGTRGWQCEPQDALLHLIKKGKQRKCAIYSCGPREMLKKIIKMGEEKRIPVYVSLEERMACGIGLCLGCSVKKRDGKSFLTICKDGPVFQSTEVEI